MSDATEDRHNSSDEELAIRGRRIFFLYPSRLLSEEIILALFRQGYDTYAVNDHVRIHHLLRVFRGSVLVVNADFRATAVDWPSYVKDILSDEGTRDTVVAVVTTEKNQDVLRRLRIGQHPSLGIINANLGAESVLESLLKELDSCGARGRRRYVRLHLVETSQSFNIDFGGHRYSGSIVDISQAGMAVVFDTPALFSMNTYFDDIQLRLSGRPIQVAGEIVATRQQASENQLFVILFDKNTKTETVAALTSFLRSNLQKEMEATMDALSDTPK